MQAIFTEEGYQNPSRLPGLDPAGYMCMQAHRETSAHTAASTLSVRSSAFSANGSIPIQHTGEGQDTAPPLSWSAPPPGTKSIAILVDDPDAPNPAAPQRTWVHWIVTGIPATTTSLPGGDWLPEGAAVGTNDWGERIWMGPLPPVGRHRYFFKIYALDIALQAPGITKLELLAAMKGHILAEGVLIGTYEKAHERRSAEQGEERTPHGRH
jgi:Raf kinase inhibitor-like YbhB/YbcL family protein